MKWANTSDANNFFEIVAYDFDSSVFVDFCDNVGTLSWRREFALGSAFQNWGDNESFVSHFVIVLCSFFVFA